MGTVLQQVEDASAELHGRDAEVEGHDSKEIGKGDLEDDGGDSEDSLQLVELVAVEAELLLQAGDVCVVCVVLVE